ncbi:butyrophilin subfamily 1 member A1-like [Patagioenas fasciata]|uniref:butyrophilin subfamily 1 member A1-like n=1 Tax=Patagioenas fasciata TaxID=372321 RepID=UPI003A9A5C69
MMLSSFHHHFSLLVFTVYGLVFQVHELHSAQLKVMGPPGPVIVAMGEDAVLPCRFSPAQSTQDMEVTWFREQLLPFVHLYKGGRDQNGNQMLEYVGRTELWKDGLAKGSVNLKIFHVQLSDRGNYTCLVVNGSDYDQAVVELQVTASGSVPLVALERYQDGGIRVSCRSAGWYPRPQVLWRDPHGQHLPSLSESVTQDQSSLFAVESSIILTRGTKQNVSCWVQHVLDGQERGSAFYISDPFFGNTHPSTIVLAIVSVVVVALLIFTVYLFKIKEKQAEELAWRRHEDPIKEVKVVLDSDTAQSCLVLSDGCKSVRREEKPQDVPEHPKRFDLWRCVMGREGFTSGRCYWEVEVDNRGGWTVGVCREDVDKKGEIVFNPEKGFWAVGLWAGCFQALTCPENTFLGEIQTPKRIRVSLDYEERRVSFFSIDKKILIFTFKETSFEGKPVYPWFWLGSGTRLKMCP